MKRKGNVEPPLLKKRVTGPSSGASSTASVAKSTSTSTSSKGKSPKPRLPPLTAINRVPPDIPREDGAPPKNVELNSYYSTFDSSTKSLPRYEFTPSTTLPHDVLHQGRPKGEEKVTYRKTPADGVHSRKPPTDTNNTPEKFKKSARLRKSPDVLKEETIAETLSPRSRSTTLREESMSLIRDVLSNNQYDAEFQEALASLIASEKETRNVMLMEELGRDGGYGGSEAMKDLYSRDEYNIYSSKRASVTPDWRGSPGTSALYDPIIERRKSIPSEKQVRESLLTASLSGGDGGDLSFVVDSKGAGGGGSSRGDTSYFSNPSSLLQYRDKAASQSGDYKSTPKTFEDIVASSISSAALLRSSDLHNVSKDEKRHGLERELESVRSDLKLIEARYDASRNIHSKSHAQLSDQLTEAHFQMRDVNESIKRTKEIRAAADESSSRSRYIVLEGGEDHYPLPSPRSATTSNKLTGEGEGGGGGAFFAGEDEGRRKDASTSVGIHTREEGGGAGRRLVDNYTDGSGVSGDDTMRDRTVSNPTNKSASNPPLPSSRPSDMDATDEDQRLRKLILSNLHSSKIADATAAFNALSAQFLPSLSPKPEPEPVVGGEESQITDFASSWRRANASYTGSMKDSTMYDDEFASTSVNNTPHRSRATTALSADAIVGDKRKSPLLDDSGGDIPVEAADGLTSHYRFTSTNTSADSERLHGGSSVVSLDHHNMNSERDRKRDSVKKDHSSPTDATDELHSHTRHHNSSDFTKVEVTREPFEKGGNGSVTGRDSFFDVYNSSSGKSNLMSKFPLIISPSPIHESTEEYITASGNPLSSHTDHRPSVDSGNAPFTRGGSSRSISNGSPPLMDEGVIVEEEEASSGSKNKGIYKDHSGSYDSVGAYQPFSVSPHSVGPGSSSPTAIAGSVHTREKESGYRHSISPRSDSKSVSPQPFPGAFTDKSPTSASGTALRRSIAMDPVPSVLHTDADLRRYSGGSNANSLYSPASSSSFLNDTTRDDYSYTTGTRRLSAFDRASVTDRRQTFNNHNDNVSSGKNVGRNSLALRRSTSRPSSVRMSVKAASPGNKLEKDSSTLTNPLSPSTAATRSSLASPFSELASVDLNNSDYLQSLAAFGDDSKVEEERITAAMVIKQDSEEILLKHYEDMCLTFENNLSKTGLEADAKMEILTNTVVAEVQQFYNSSILKLRQSKEKQATALIAKFEAEKMRIITDLKFAHAKENEEMVNKIRLYFTNSLLEDIENQRAKFMSISSNQLKVIAKASQVEKKKILEKTLRESEAATESKIESMKEAMAKEHEDAVKYLKAQLTANEETNMKKEAAIIERDHKLKMDKITKEYLIKQEKSLTEQRQSLLQMFTREEEKTLVELRKALIDGSHGNLVEYEKMLKDEKAVKVEKMRAEVARLVEVKKEKLRVKYDQDTLDEIEALRSENEVVTESSLQMLGEVLMKQKQEKLDAVHAELQEVKGRALLELTQAASENTDLNVERVREDFEEELQEAIAEKKQQLAEDLQRTLLEECKRAIKKKEESFHKLQEKYRTHRISTLSEVRKLFNYGHEGSGRGKGVGKGHENSGNGKSKNIDNKENTPDASNTVSSILSCGSKTLERKQVEDIVGQLSRDNKSMEDQMEETILQMGAISRELIRLKAVDFLNANSSSNSASVNRPITCKNCKQLYVANQELIERIKEIEAAKLQLLTSPLVH